MEAQATPHRRSCLFLSIDPQPLPMSSWAPRGLQTGLILQVGGLLGGAFQPGLQVSSRLTKESRELKKTLATPISSTPSCEAARSLAQRWTCPPEPARQEGTGPGHTPLEGQQTHGCLHSRRPSAFLGASASHLQSHRGSVLEFTSILI